MANFFKMLQMQGHYFRFKSWSLNFSFQTSTNHHRVTTDLQTELVQTPFYRSWYHFPIDYRQKWPQTILKVIFFSLKLPPRASGRRTNNIVVAWLYVLTDFRLSCCYLPCGEKQSINSKTPNGPLWEPHDRIARYAAKMAHEQNF